MTRSQSAGDHESPRRDRGVVGVVAAEGDIAARHEDPERAGHGEWDAIIRVHAVHRATRPEVHDGARVGGELGVESGH